MIIAELGLNHLGNPDLAESYISILSKCDVDGISFQVREKEYYERDNKKQLKFSDKNYIDFSRSIKESNKKFGVAIADIEKIDFFESINTDFYKIIRNDITNTNLVKKILSTGKKVIVSTGLSSENDIDLFLSQFGEYKNFVLNHTQLSYEEKDCNLKAISSLRDKYNVPISFGSHCSNINVLYMSLCFNPSDILFYVKLNNKIKYPDDKHAVTLNDCSSFLNNIKMLQSAVGSGKKQKLINKIN